MGDQKRWFKLWHTILDDDDILSLSPTDRWAFAALGCYLVVHGHLGRVMISPRNPALAVAFGCGPEALLDTLKRLPHVRVENTQSDNGKIAVIMENWTKYQEDSTIYKRVKAFRKRHDVTVIRGEERRREEKRVKPPPTSPPLDWSLSDPIAHALSRTRFARLSDQREFWQAHFRAQNGLDFPAQILRAEAWCASNSDRAPKKNLKRFLHNWFQRAQEEER